MKNYSPEEMSVIFRSHIITGFADGTFIKVGRNKESSTLKVGSQGHATRTHHGDKSGFVEVTLQRAAESNGVLSTFLADDEQNKNGQGPILVRDNLGNDLHAGPESFIMKAPDVEYADEDGSIVWRFEVANLRTFLGGN